MDNKIKYFEIIKIVNNVFSSKLAVDYTRISPEDLIARFDLEISNSYIFDEARLQKVRDTIRAFQKYIYDRKSNVEGAINDKGFDKLNYAIQNCISKMKNVALRELLSGGNAYPLIEPGQSYDPKIFGELEELEEHITKDNITKYIKDTLTLTCSNIERINSSLLDPSALIRDIFFQFGIKPDSKTVGPTAFKKAEALVKEAIYDSTRGSGSLLPGNSDNDYQQVYERYYTDLEFFNTKMDKAVRAISELVSSIALPALELTRAHVKAEEYGKRTIETRLEPEFIDDEDDIKTDSENIEDKIEKYQQMQEYLKNNIELAKSLAAIDKEIEDTRLKLNQLLTKREEIQQALGDNDNKIRRGL